MSDKEWFLDDMTPEEFEKLSGEERLRKIMQHELKDLSGDELKARVDEFVKKLRLSRLNDKTSK
jgi:ABC-type Na+ transport system ATPase subunit NatA